MVDVVSLPPFVLRSMPEVRYGAGQIEKIGTYAARLAEPSRTVAIVADGAMEPLGHLQRLASKLSRAGAQTVAFTDIAGDPKIATAEHIREFIRTHDAGLVVCLGGGSAMDAGKTAATLAHYPGAISDYTMSGAPITYSSLPKICVPTSSGTGSELSSTNILSNAAGRKVWVWSAMTKPDLVLLDPQLSTTLPPELTALSGLDAFAHCFEACTNTFASRGVDLFAHKGMQLIVDALEMAVMEPDNLDARGQLMLGAAYGGIAIDTCNVAMAHNIAHALAALAPIHHGLATALAIHVCMPWWVQEDQDGAFARASAVCGLGDNPRVLDTWYRDWLGRLDVERRLPKAFTSFTAADLAHEMRRPETRAMRRTNKRCVREEDIDRLAAQVMAMAY